MKKLHTSILDTLSNYFTFDQASEIAFDVLEFGFKSKEILRFDIFDMVADYYTEDKAKAIATEAIAHI